LNNKLLIVAWGHVIEKGEHEASSSNSGAAVDGFDDT
jgi:hypothetical protein